MQKQVLNFDGIKGVARLGEETIRLHEIELDLVNNSARPFGIDPAHVNRLTSDIKARGILRHLPKPVVERLTPELRRKFNIKSQRKKYILLDGHHRFKAFLALLFMSAEFDVVECDDEWSRRKFQLKANTHPPAKSSSVVEYVHYLTDRVSAEDILNVQSSLENELDSLAESLNPTLRQQIIKETMKANGSTVQWLNWSRQDAANFLADVELTQSMLWNASTGNYGAVLTAGAETRVIGNALDLYNAIGPDGERWTQTDCVIKVDRKGDATVMEKRRGVRDAANNHLQNILDSTNRKSFPNGVPIRFIGYLPQCIDGGEDAHTFYEINPEDPLIDGA